MNFEDDILIVDDEIPNLRLLAELLEKEGYRVRPAAKAQTAIDSAQAKPPGLILLDVRMPEMDGFELCRRLKQDERTHDIPIIFVSALQDIDDKVRGFEAGGVDFISKPYQEQEILARVRTHMSLDQMRQHLEQRTAQLEQEIAERKRAEAALQASEQFLQRTLDTLTAHIAILDEGGVIIGLNGAWRQFAQNNHMAWPDHGLGRNCLALLDAVSGEATASAQQAAAAIRAVIAGERDYFWLEYDCHSPTEPRWFVMHVTRFDSERGVRVVMAHENITERKQAELALQESNQDLNQRLDELSTLNLIGQSVSTVVDLPDALDLVVATVTRLFDALGTGILLLSDDRSELTLVSFFDRRFPVFSIAGNSEDIPTNSAQRGMVFPVKDDRLTQELLGEGQSIVIPDAQHDPRLSEAHYILRAGQVGCLMLVPLLSKGNAIGLIGIATDQPEREFTPDEVMLAETIAGQITGAFETARLFEQVQNVAALEERSRLAQDLHDSVTQAIYSASLIAETMPAIWAEDPDEGQSGLEQLQRYTQGALAEMRTLLLELRPLSLANQDLPTLLRQLETAMMARTETVVTTTVVGDCSVPTDVKVALYRITQEALNNVVKHARARQVLVTLTDDSPRIILSINDDGCGFDPEAEPPHQLGLDIMRDRAQSISAMLSITSRPDEGTEVLVEWRDGEG